MTASTAFSSNNNTNSNIYSNQSYTSPQKSNFRKSNANLNFIQLNRDNISNQ